MVAHFHRLYTSKRSSGNYFGTRERITLVQTFHLVRPKLENVSRACAAVIRNRYQIVTKRTATTPYLTSCYLIRVNLFDESYLHICQVAQLCGIVISALYSLVNHDISPHRLLTTREPGSWVKTIVVISG